MRMYTFAVPRTVIACIISCLCIFLQSCSNPKAAVTSVASASVYDRVMTAGKIRCGYGIYRPGCMKDPNTGKMYGIGVEALEAIAKKLGLEIEWVEEVGWGTMIEGLQTDRYDIIATPVWTQANRARVASFSRPLYYSPVMAYVRYGDKRFADGDLSRLNSPEFQIESIDGATAEQIAREDFPKARLMSLPQTTDFGQLLLNISTGKADITFTEPLDAIGFMKQNPKSIELVTTPNPVRVFPNCWMFKRDQTAFKEMIDTVLEQLINSGVIDRLIAKYEPAPHTVYPVAPQYLKR